MPQIHPQSHSAKDKYLLAEDINKRLSISSGIDITELICELQALRLELKPPDPAIKSIILRKVQFISAHELKSFDWRVSLCEMLREKHATVLLSALNGRHEKIIDIMNEVFKGRFRKMLQVNLSSISVEKLIGEIHANLWVCIYYTIGYMLLGDHKTAKKLKKFIEAFQAGNFPLQRTTNNSLLFLTQ